MEKQPQIPVLNKVLGIFLLGLALILYLGSIAGSDLGGNSTNPVPTSTAKSNAPVGNTFYVSPNGDDSNPGTQSQPWKTVQKAADSAQPGHKIFVLSGNYAERVVISRSGSANQHIIFQAQGSVVLYGFIIKADYVTIQGFEINNPAYSRHNNEVSTGIFLQGSNLLIANNYIHDSPRVGIYMDSSSIHDNTIRGNRLFRNGDSGILISGNNHLIESNEIWETVQCHPVLLSVEGISSCVHGNSLGLDADGMDFFGQGHVIRNNFIHDIRLGDAGVNVNNGDYNNDAHIDCFQTWDGKFGPADNIIFDGNRCAGLDGNAGWQLHDASNLTIKNNVVESPIGINTAAGGNHHLFITNNVFANNLEEGIEVVNSPYTIVKNNILYNQNGQTILLFGDKTGVEISYNVAYNSNGSIPQCIVMDDYTCLNLSPDHNLWNIDPLFINPVSGDYRPQTGSPVCSGGSDGTYIGAFSC